MDKGADTSPPFRRLAAYIGVGSDALNDQHEKIAMTAPVLNEGNASAVNETAAEATTTGGGSTALTATTVQDNEVMMFLLPSKYNEKNEPPKPDMYSLVLIRDITNRRSKRSVNALYNLAYSNRKRTGDAKEDR